MLIEIFNFNKILTEFQCIPPWKLKAYMYLSLGKVVHMILQRALLLVFRSVVPLVVVVVSLTLSSVVKMASPLNAYFSFKHLWCSTFHGRIIVKFVHARRVPIVHWWCGGLFVTARICEYHFKFYKYTWKFWIVMEIDTVVLACDICMGDGTSYVAVDCLYFVKHWNMVSLSKPPLQRRENSSSYKKYILALILKLRI